MLLLPELAQLRLTSRRLEQYTLHNFTRRFFRTVALSTTDLEDGIVLDRPNADLFRDATDCLCSKVDSDAEQSQWQTGFAPMLASLDQLKSIDITGIYQHTFERPTVILEDLHRGLQASIANITTLQLETCTVDPASLDALLHLLALSLRKIRLFSVTLQGQGVDDLLHRLTVMLLEEVWFCTVKVSAHQRTHGLFELPRAVGGKEIESRDQLRDPPRVGRIQHYRIFCEQVCAIGKVAVTRALARVVELRGKRKG